MTPDARDLLTKLVGVTVFTVGQRKPNRVLRIDGSAVVVATEASPSGQPVRIAEVQTALDLLYANGEVAIEKDAVGYRSAFIGAVLATLADVGVFVRPRRARLRRQ